MIPKATDMFFKVYAVHKKTRAMRTLIIFVLSGFLHHFAFTSGLF
jgi:hypothetical protein